MALYWLPGPSSASGHPLLNQCKQMVICPCVQAWGHLLKRPQAAQPTESVLSFHPIHSVDGFLLSQNFPASPTCVLNGSLCPGLGFSLQDGDQETHSQNVQVLYAQRRWPEQPLMFFLTSKFDRHRKDLETIGS